MKFSTKIKLSDGAKLSVAMMMLLLGGPAMAQSQGAGNGGHPAEVAEMQGANGARLESWYTVKQDLIKGLELGRHSELTFEAGVTADSFKASAMNALKTTVLDFGDQKIEIAGARRACRNWVEASGVGRIYCDLPYLIETMKLFDSEAQYRFIAHEYLSVAGLEPNEYGSSAYPYSSQISKSLRTVESKRWGIVGVSEPVLPTLGAVKLRIGSIQDDREVGNYTDIFTRTAVATFSMEQKFPWQKGKREAEHEISNQLTEASTEFGDYLAARWARFWKIYPHLLNEKDLEIRPWTFDIFSSREPSFARLPSDSYEINCKENAKNIDCGGTLSYLFGFSSRTKILLVKTEHQLVKGITKSKRMNRAVAVKEEWLLDPSTLLVELDCQDAPQCYVKRIYLELRK